VALPGGDFAVDGFDRLVKDLQAAYPFLGPDWARRLVRAYGTEARDILGDAQSAADLGPEFGATLTGAEVRWQMRREYAREAADVVWRRTRLGLKMNDAQIAALDEWMRQERGAVDAAPRAAEG
jgi:glycerol-3-phosphate dehydrogenase